MSILLEATCAFIVFCVVLEISLKVFDFVEDTAMGKNSFKVFSKKCQPNHGVGVKPNHIRSKAFNGLVDGSSKSRVTRCI